MNKPWTDAGRDVRKEASDPTSGSEKAGGPLRTVHIDWGQSPLAKTHMYFVLIISGN